MPVDILAIGVHPDDVELSCSGSLLANRTKGFRFGILDLTKGELGTRGNADLRVKEAAAAAQILGSDFRKILNMKDGFFQIDQSHILPIVEIIREAKPQYVLANAIVDRHPDHGRAAQLINEACFYSGLRKIETDYIGKEQAPWRPKAVYFYVQDYVSTPDLVVDTTGFMDQKLEAIKAFNSQFYKEGSTEPESPISSKDFLDFIKSRDKVMGRYIGVEYGEGFKVARPIGVRSFNGLV
ncbi:MAG: bacillithiol biosynthesis deacetylase BshB1 [Saprospiraceae bacterium]|nr:bacillithiol biosynthesis deacetylase BshB1 [Saprospiraceae bacterium]